MVLVLYGLWIAGPFLHSIVVRDAAVTTWLHVATAPIAGQLDDTALRPGSIVAPDRLLTTIVNPLADRTALARAEAELAAARARLEQFNQISAHRQAELASYSEAFIHDLDLRIASQTASAGYIAHRLEAERADAARFTTLLASGGASSSAAQAASARVASIEVERVTADDNLQRTTLRRDNATHGIYLAEDGLETDWSARLDPVRLEEERLAADQAVAAATAVVAAAREIYARSQAATLNAPAGSVVWNRLVTSGSTVAAGAPVVTWIDPSVLFVDVPVSDAQVSILHPGARAKVVIEGEHRTRAGLVILSRGSAATLDHRELAAVTRGRWPGTGQVLVRIDSDKEDRSRQLVGLTAYVDFPDISFFDIVRARLRW